MMKKHSILILFLSVLLCFSMLLTSCDFGKTKDETEATTEAETEAPEVVDAVVDYKSIVQKWSEHLTFTAPVEEKTVLSEANSVFSDAENDNLNVKASQLGWFYVVENERLETVFYNDPAMPGIELSKIAVVERLYRVYDAATGSMILEKRLTVDEEDPYSPTCRISPVTCGAIYLQILEVETLAYKTETDDQGQETRVPVLTYTYYDTNGTRIASQETPASAVMNVGMNITLDLGEKIYTFSDVGELLYVFEKGTERLIPYGAKEYGAYLYVFNGLNVTVVDQAYKKVYSYTESDDYDWTDRYVIANGERVVYQYQTLVGTPDSAYDFENFGGNQYLISHVIVDVKNGSVTEVERDFRIVKLLTEVDAEETGIAAKDGQQLAIIRKIAEDTLSNDYVFAILDNELNVVAELPSFIKAQSDVVGMLDGDRLLIASSTYDKGQQLYYTVSLKSGTVELYVDAIDSAYEWVENGFIHGEKLYNDECEELLDLGDYVSYNVYDDFLILREEFAVSLCYIQDGELVNTTIADFENAVVIVGGGYVIVGLDESGLSDRLASASIYNNAGQLLLGTVTELIYEGLLFGEDYAWVKCVDDSGTGSGNYYILK